LVTLGRSTRWPCKLVTVTKRKLDADSPVSNREPGIKRTRTVGPNRCSIRTKAVMAPS
jgi:hypothetical protein